MSVTAVLLNWRRPYAIPQIVDHLRTFPQVTDIIVWDNSPADSQPGEFKRLHTGNPYFDLDNVVVSQCNECTFGRFLAASISSNDTIFVADDDLIVNNIPQLLDAYDGTRIVANLADDGHSKHWQFWEHDPKPYVEIGFGAVFPKQFAIDYLGIEWTTDRELARRKADKAFTMLFPWTYMRAGPDDITRLYHEGEEIGRDTNALYLRRDHAALTRRSVEEVAAYKAKLGGVVR